jgi:hypothetical protein
MAQLAELQSIASEGDTFEADLLMLQREQVEHDERFHREIVRLDAHNRIKHISLHLAKYNCHLQISWNEVDLRERVITDALIMAISGLSMLNRSIATEWFGEGRLNRARQVQILKDRFDCPHDRFVMRFAELALPAIAGAEKLDHIEAFDYRAEFVSSFANIAGLCFVWIARSGSKLDAPIDTVRKRLLTVKRKNIFFDN